MGWGGARKGSGRKPKPLAEKVAAGNPGHRPLKKVEWEGGNETPALPEYFRHMKYTQIQDGVLPSPSELFQETVAHLEPSGCMNLIPNQLIADYAMAKYFLLIAQLELTQTGIILQKGKNEYIFSDFAQAMLKMQKNVLAAWTPIWDIVSRNSEKTITNPEEDMIGMILSRRTRKQRPKGEPDDGGNENPQDSGGEAESGEV